MNSTDHWMMIRRVGVVLLLLIVACGEAAGDIQTIDAKQGGPTSSSTASSTTTASSATSTMIATTTTEVGENTQTNNPVSTVLADLGLGAGVPIDPPADFPAISDLDPERFSFPAYPTPHSRGRISSRLEVGDQPGPQSDDGSWLDGYEYTITYVDNFTVWEHADGSREVRTQDGSYLYQTDDGTWRESDAFEWPPFGPLVEWSEAQYSAAGILATGSTVVGYELLADTPTVHLRWPEAPPGTWADVWLDARGAVMRIVVDVGLALGNQNEGWLVWDVLTLDPDDPDPLPPLP